ncbi:MAG: GNAT family N-acetyltransferase [Candidatus Acidiferrales bacterium]
MASSASSPAIHVRPARRSDVPRLTSLCGQLGYPSTEHQVAARLAAIESMPEHALFVADASNGMLAGFLDIFVMRTIESDARAEIAGLVVDETYRSQGVGQLLIDSAEAWAREHGCTAVSLRTNVIRERAHAFYEREGYKHIKTQKSYRKPL